MLSAWQNGRKRPDGFEVTMNSRCFWGHCKVQEKVINSGFLEATAGRLHTAIPHVVSGIWGI